MATIGTSSNTTPPMAQELNRSTIIIIAAAAFAILCLILELLYLPTRERRNHKRLMADLERRGINIRPQETGPRQQVSKMNPPRNVSRRSTFLPFGATAGWNTLESCEDLSTEAVPKRPAREVATKKRKKRRSSPRVFWPFSRRASAQVPVPMEEVDNARLSAIVESPAIIPACSPQVTLNGNPVQVNGPESQVTRHLYDASGAIGQVLGDAPESLKPEPLTVSKKRGRAQTVGTSIRRVSPLSEPRVSRNMRPTMHARSFSLGSQSPGCAPHAPIPPLPLNVEGVQGANRPHSYVEGNTPRLSISSLESIGSSLLVASPEPQRSSSAKLQAGARRDYTNSLIMGPRMLYGPPNAEKRPQSSPGQNMHSLRGSIRSNPESLQSTDGTGHVRTEGELTASSAGDLLTLGGISTAEAVRMSRVSVVSNGGALGGGLNVTTPRRQSRFLVTLNGSPAQRRKSVALKEICGTQATLTRQLSQTSESASSTRSSNGNPFHWDPSPLASGKPSALKGSPSARRGHKRQNCVRISLSPTIINSQSKSPSPIMADIQEQEESPEFTSKNRQAVLAPESSTRALPRPPSSSTFDPDVKISPTTLRASLTPSSPTLSLAPYGHDQSRAQSHHSLTFSARKEGNRRGSGSLLDIPTFPSPGKTALTTLTTNVMATPTFSYTRPSNEFDEGVSPPEDFKLLAQPFVPQEISTETLTTAGAAASTNGSLPASIESFIYPRLEKEELKASKPPLETLSTTPHHTPGPSFTPQQWSGPSSKKETLAPLSPPCSPKSTPRSPVARERSPPSSPSIVQETNKNPATILPSHSPSPIPIPGLNIYNQSLQAPQGPREPPASELRMLVSRLRRSNSDANNDAEHPKHRAARRYQRLGRRENSPLLDQGPGRCDSWISVSAGTGLTGIRESMGSLMEIDRVLEGNFEGHDEIDEDQGMEGLSLEGESGKGREDSDTLGELGSSDERCEEVDSTQERRSKKRRGSVWDDGEVYWQEKEGLSKEEDTPLPLAIATNTQNRNDGVGRMPLLPHRVSEMRKSAILEKLSAAVRGFGTPEVKIQPPSSDRGTPGSLYDENGFLKSP